MPVKMAPHQLEFWQELLSPFPPELLSTTKRGGRELTYVDKRAITNRLDSVCGPDGWYPEYEATARGYKCRLYIQVPTRTEGTFIFMHKEDGAGFEEMGAYNKQTNEWEADVDNDEKSGYTNALRRAAQDAWGIGRYLYNKGIPSFLDRDAQPAENSYGEARTTRTPNRGPDPNQSGVKPYPEAHAAAPKAAAPAPAPAPVAPAQKQFDNFRLPKSGRQVYPWMKEMEKEFEIRLMDGMLRTATENGFGKQMLDWAPEQTQLVCMAAVKRLRELPTYKGQYEFLFPGGASEQPTIAPAAVPGVNIADLRKTLMDRMKALVAKQVGREPTNVELKQSFENIASSTANAEGHIGEVPESLSKMTDVKWLANMIAFVDGQIALAVAIPEGEEIPF